MHRCSRDACVYRGRDAARPIEIWLTEHEPVFTQGQAGKAEHLLAPGDIEVVQSTVVARYLPRPGQIVGYLLFDLRRLGIGVAILSRHRERHGRHAGEYGIQRLTAPDAPGVYVDGAKIGVAGPAGPSRLLVPRPEPERGYGSGTVLRINPCGLLDTEVTQMAILARRRCCGTGKTGWWISSGRCTTQRQQTGQAGFFGA